jgi:hypothetical protein
VRQLQKAHKLRSNIKAGERRAATDFRRCRWGTGLQSRSSSSSALTHVHDRDWHHLTVHARPPFTHMLLPCPGKGVGTPNPPLRIQTGNPGDIVSEERITQASVEAQASRSRSRPPPILLHFDLSLPCHPLLTQDQPRKGLPPLLL